MDLNMYLKYGISKGFIYGDPVPIIDISLEDAKKQFRENLLRSINSFPSDGVAFCGTMSACSMLQLKKMPTCSVDIGIDTEKTSKLLGCKHHQAQIPNVEKALIKIIKEINPFFRSSLEDIYAFARQKYWSGFAKKGLCEGGTDYILTAPDYGKSYQDYFNDSITIFNDNELEDLGVDPIHIKLREDNLEHYFKAMFDWGYKTVYEYRTKPFAKYFGFETFSPYINDPEMVNFCLSLPLGMKNYFGRRKHILKEAIPIPQNIKNNMVNRIFPNIYNTIKPEVKKLVNKYLKDESRIIFNFLPYNKVQKYLDDFIKEWNLLNLSIWMEDV